MLIIETFAQQEKELKVSVRTSLRASSIDGALSTVFSNNITGGVLLSSFLLDLLASSLEIGLLSSLILRLVALLSLLWVHESRV